MLEYLYDIWLWTGVILYIIPIKVYYWGEPNDELYDDIFPEQRFVRWIVSYLYLLVKTIVNFIMKIIKFLLDLYEY